MSYLLDTNICISFLNGDDRGLRDRLLELSPEECCLCSIVKAELIFGARKSKRTQENLELLNEFFKPFESHSFDDAAAELYGLIRNQLEISGRPIGANDLLIASIALAKDLVLVTRNRLEFIRVPGLRTEEW